MVGLDIGTTKISVMIGRKNQYGKLEILGTGRSVSNGVARGIVANIDKTVDSIKEAIKEANKKSGIEIGEVFVGIAGQHIKSLQHRGELVRDNIEIEIEKSDIDKLKSNMLKLIKRQLTTKLESTDWYYLRKLRTGNDVPSDIQNYSDTLYSEYDTKKTEIGLMMKMSQIKEFENKSFTEVRKVESTNTEGKTVYGPKTESTTRHINMCTQWTSNPNDDIDPAFVSLTAD